MVGRALIRVLSTIGILSLSLFPSLSTSSPSQVSLSQAERLLCVYVYGAGVSMQCLRWQEAGVGSPRTRVREYCEHGCLKWKLGPLQRQYYFSCLQLCGCVSVDTCTWGPGEGIRSMGANVASHYKLPDWDWTLVLWERGKQLQGLSPSLYPWYYH